jgi:hypothetical protein
MEMKRKSISSIILALAVTVALCGLPAFAQNAQDNKNVNTNTRMIYHDGPIMTGSQSVYLIWYGCWDDTCSNGNSTTQALVTDFMWHLGGSPYFQINAMYPNGAGQTPTGALFYGGSVFDRYSHGLELTASDITGIVADQIVSNALPQDPVGIYVVLASQEVSSVSTGFCVPSALAHHGTGSTLGAQFKYAFVGNPNRCPTLAAPQFFSGSAQSSLPTMPETADITSPRCARSPQSCACLTHIVSLQTAYALFHVAIQ